MSAVLTLTRVRGGEQGTLGRLEADGLPPLWAIELPWRDNRPRRSCIPAGQYRLEPFDGRRFRGAVIVLGVPGRSAILIHRGNLAGDRERGWAAHSLGCILPGTRPGSLRPGTRDQRAVLGSVTAERLVRRWAEDAPDAILDVREAA